MHATSVWDLSMLPTISRSFLASWSVKRSPLGYKFMLYNICIVLYNVLVKYDLGFYQSSATIQVIEDDNKNKS